MSGLETVTTGSTMAGGFLTGMHALVSRTVIAHGHERVALANDVTQLTHRVGSLQRRNADIQAMLYKVDPKLQNMTPRFVEKLVNEEKVNAATIRGLQAKDLPRARLHLEASPRFHPGRVFAGTLSLAGAAAGGFAAASNFAQGHYLAAGSNLIAATGNGLVARAAFSGRPAGGRVGLALAVGGSIASLVTNGR